MQILGSAADILAAETHLAAAPLQQVTADIYGIRTEIGGCLQAFKVARGCEQLGFGHNRLFLSV